jgi:integrase
MDTNTTPSTAVTVAEILWRYERDCLQDLAPRTQIDYGRHVVTLRQTFGHRIVTELEPKDFGPFLAVRKGKVQRVKQLAVLSAAFTQAVSFWYWIPRNVLKDVARPKFKPRDRLVEQQEFDAVRALAPYRVKLAMDLAVMTGQRQGDILNFRWSDIKDCPEPIVDPITGEEVTSELHVYQSKTGKRLAIGISKDLENTLDQCWKLPNRGEFVLSSRFSQQFTGEGFRAMWQRALRKYASRGFKRFTFHDLRALAATRCPTPEIAMRLLGHTNISMTLRIYRRGVERVQALGLQPQQKRVSHENPISMDSRIAPPRSDAVAVSLQV